MPYNPHTQNHAGEYIMRGAEIASKAIADGIQGLHQSNQEHDYLDGMADYYFGGDPDQLQKYKDASVGAKRGMITGAQAQDQKETAQHTQDMSDWYKTDQSQRDWSAQADRDQSWTPGADVLQHAQDAGMVYLPQSKKGGTYVPMADKPQPSTPMGTDPTGTGNFYYNGKTLEQVHGSTTLPPSAAANIETILAKNKAIDDTIASHQSEISNGNQYPGLDLWGKLTGSKSYSDQITDLTAQKARNLDQIDTIRKTLVPPKPTVPTGNTPAGAGGGAAPAPVQTPALPAGGGGVNLSLMPTAGGAPLPIPAATPTPTAPAGQPGAGAPAQATTPQAGGKPAGWSDDAIKQDAAGAIKSGASRAAVVSRLAQWGVDTSGL